MTVLPILAIEAGAGIQPEAGLRVAVAPSAGFGAHLISGLEEVNSNLLQADAAARRFAVDDTIAPHQVTFALEQARMSLELMLQVRSRLIEGYQELMRMQL